MFLARKELILALKNQNILNHPYLDYQFYILLIFLSIYHSLFLKIYSMFFLLNNLNLILLILFLTILFCNFYFCLVNWLMHLLILLPVEVLLQKYFFFLCLMFLLDFQSDSLYY